MTAMRLSESVLEDRVAERYTQEGYEVIHQPDSNLLPFDLGAYRPDLLVVKPGGERYLVEIKGTSAAIPVEKYREVAQRVAQEPGWRFLLVTNVEADEALPDTQKPLDWAAIEERMRDAERLRGLGEVEAGLLTLWAAFEATVRNRAIEEHLPLESLRISSVINYLYSHGELSMEQFDAALELQRIRNQVAHGFQSDRVDGAFNNLSSLMRDLVMEWRPT